jgi:hypothetical protein
LRVVPGNDRDGVVLPLRAAPEKKLERELGEVDAGNPFHKGPPTGIRCPDALFERAGGARTFSLYQTIVW